MVTNLRIRSVVVQSSTSIQATFTESLNPEISAANIAITPQTPGVPAPQIISVSIALNVLTINTQPMTPLAAYFISFQSTNTILFSSINGDAVILNDGITNKQLIVAPIDDSNPVKTYFLNYFNQNVYNTAPGTVISSFLDGVSTVLAQALYDIHQSANENYLSYTVIDERHTRGTGAFDRLGEESAYDIIRVGTGLTNTSVAGTVSVPNFPEYKVSLLATAGSENLSSNYTGLNGTFNPNTLILNLTNQNVIILDSITFFYNTGSPYTYNIEEYGYQILNSDYDPEYAFTYLQLSNNQIRLNSSVLTDSNFSLEGIKFVQANYQYKDLGRVIDPTSVNLDVLLSSGREVLPSIENIVTLKHAPIVTSTDKIGTIGSIVFVDPNALPGSNTPHPAFLYEIPFRFDYLPSTPGQYSVNYQTGQVYVYGADSQQTGTGAYPPVAIYTYRYNLVDGVDYVYDSDFSDLAALPNGNTIGENVNVYFNYEEVLVNGVDYVANIHVEALEEFVQNRLVALNAISTLNTPITDVFRILNQTTGEIYNPLYWTNNSVYFSYVNPPHLVNQTYERVQFQPELNEVLYVNTVSTVSINQSLFTIYLQNNNIMDNTDDGIGSSINSSLSFSNQNIFVKEKYFDKSLSVATNNSLLKNNGDYQVDYANGVIYLLVSNTQTSDIGNASYKRSYVLAKNNNIITLNDIYYQPTPLTQKLKHFSYNSFTYNTVLPSTFDVSDEGFLNGNFAYPYQLHNSQVGVFESGATFTAGVTNAVNYVRGLFEYEDLINNPLPINFAFASTASNNNISVSTLSYQEYHTVQYDGTHYYVTANNALLYLSPNITLTVQVTRLSDSAALWNNSGTVTLGSPVVFVLPGVNTPHAGDAVLLTYSFTIKDLSRLVIDYDKGGYYIDYTYLYDDIVISYEYGDNILDFRSSSALNAGDTYYVSYKVGALRDALLKNFGTLIDVPILNTLDVNLDRERYRDALIAAMQSFTQGPTLTSIKNIVSTIVHAPPTVTENAFTGWTLGTSLLSPESIKTTGAIQLAKAKYGNGAIVDQPGQTITFPVSSNIRLEEGTLECWVAPTWNGIDNKSDVTFSITKNGSPLPANQIFIGPTGYHPTIAYGQNSFTLNTGNKVAGVPNQSKDGVFIYYAPDPSTLYQRWYVDVLDGYGDGYNIKNYAISINTDGKFYDVKSVEIPKPASDSIASGTNTVNYLITGLTSINTGITFIADEHHYLFDFGASTKENRFSIFKDESGYLNFRIIDKNKTTYQVSADISSWKAGDWHHVATSWALNTKNSRDELHLFVDGIEVPNIIKYGEKVSPYLHQKFRTVNEEQVVGVVNAAIVSSNDLVTTAGSNIVSSSLNFIAYGVSNGETIIINEPGFAPAGYTINSVSGQQLVLSSVMPLSTTNSSFSINPTTFPVAMELDIYPNIAVYLIHNSTSGNDLSTQSNSAVVTSALVNFTTLGVLPGYLIRIANSNFANYYTILAVNGHNLTITDNAPLSLTNQTFYIYPNTPVEIPGQRALQPAYSVSRNNTGAVSLTLTNDARANDIVLIETLGLNARRILTKYYVWGSGSNIIQTYLPTPVTLNDVKITHIPLNYTVVGPNNSVYAGGLFTSTLTTDQPSVSDTGRYLSVNISGTNVDYSTPVTVRINGNVTETLSFSQNGTLNTTHQFTSITNVVVTCKPINSGQNCVVINIRELDPITVAEGSSNAPVIRYSYQTVIGNTLSGSGNTVTDENAFFSVETEGNYLVISSPSNVAGIYQILSVSLDHRSAILSKSLAASFTNGVYQLIDTTTYSSGLQNGLFTFEDGYAPADGYAPGQPYNLAQGYYEFDYYTYLSIPMGVDKMYAHVGSSLEADHQFDGIIDELNIVSEKLTDVRIGETVSNSVETITQDYNSLKPLTPNSSTLVLAHFESLPFTNDASYYVLAPNAGPIIQSGYNVNSSFDNSIVLTDRPYIVDNTGILDVRKNGTIEFWISPLYDTYNDPNYRYYFDASAIVSEKTISTNNATVKVAGSISSVISVKLQVGDQTVDYFAGGTIGSDNKTIYLNRRLPNQQTPVVVNYLPAGVNGDRLSIYKDPYGYINFDVLASGLTYQVRAPIFWVKNSWHRVKAQYIFNTGIGSDQVRLFLDGYERGNILVGNGLLFGQPQVFGSTFIGPNNLLGSISFKDTINELFIGSNYFGGQTAYAIFNNFRISNVFRPLFIPFGEAIDSNYSANISINTPVVQDLYTTFLLDLSKAIKANTDFSTLKNRYTGQFDFSVEIHDIFNIVGENPQVKQILETLITTLQPANTQSFISY